MLHRPVEPAAESGLSLMSAYDPLLPVALRKAVVHGLVALRRTGGRLVMSLDYFICPR